MNADYEAVATLMWFAAFLIWGNAAALALIELKDYWSKKQGRE